MIALKDQSKFNELEAAIATLPPGMVEMIHHFAPGIYGRQMNMDPGTVLTGKVHRFDCLNIVCGDISVHNAEDGSTERIAGFRVFVSKAGTRRAGIAHGFTSWVTIHPTEETDLEKIEEAVILKYENPLLVGMREAIQ